MYLQSEKDFSSWDGGLDEFGERDSMKVVKAGSLMEMLFCSRCRMSILDVEDIFSIQFNFNKNWKRKCKILLLILLEYQEQAVQKVGS